MWAPLVRTTHSITLPRYFLALTSFMPRMACMISRVCLKCTRSAVPRDLAPYKQEEGKTSGDESAGARGLSGCLAEAAASLTASGVGSLAGDAALANAPSAPSRL